MKKRLADARLEATPHHESMKLARRQFGGGRKHEKDTELEERKQNTGDRIQERINFEIKPISHSRLRSQATAGQGVTRRRPFDTLRAMAGQAGKTQRNPVFLINHKELSSSSVARASPGKRA